MTADYATALGAARAFAHEVIAPHADHWERLGRVPYEAFEQAGENGLCGLIVPSDFGGLGLDVAGMTAVTGTLAAACMSATFSFVVHNNLAGFIARHGSAVHRARYLEEMLRGRKVGAFLLTEPEAGSDAQSISTSARKVDGGWVIDGEKAWVSNATFADVLSVYAQTEAGSGAKGIAAFLVDADAAGVRRSEGYDLMRGHALGVGGVVFENCAVADDALILPAGAAFKAALAGIDTARINVAAMCCGMLRQSLRYAIDYAAERTAFGQSTLEFQGLQWQLADVATDLEAAELLTERAVARVDGGIEANVDVAHAKKFATRVAFDGIAQCMQAMGAAGYLAEHGLARHLAAAKMAQFLDGTTEIQNVVIGRQLRARYGSAKPLEA